jgi:hypothetical protein
VIVDRVTCQRTYACPHGGSSLIPSIPQCWGPEAACVQGKRRLGRPSLESLRELREALAAGVGESGRTLSTGLEGRRFASAVLRRTSRTLRQVGRVRSVRCGGAVTGTVRTSARAVARVASVRELTARLTVRRRLPIRVLDSGSGLLADGMTGLTVAVRTWTRRPEPRRATGSRRREPAHLCEGSRPRLFVAAVSAWP